jgi:hypothetical protein
MLGIIVQALKKKLGHGFREFSQKKKSKELSVASVKSMAFSEKIQVHLLLRARANFGQNLGYLIRSHVLLILLLDRFHLISEPQLQFF